MSAIDEIRFLNCVRPKLDVDDVKELVLAQYGIEGDFDALNSERDQNFCIAVGGENRFVFKISNVSELAGSIDFQVSAMSHILTQNPGLPIPQIVPNKLDQDYSNATFRGGQQHIVHMLRYVAGVPVGDLDNPPSAATRRRIGQLIANTDIALRGFFHPAADQDHPWGVAKCARFASLIHHIDDGPGRKLIEGVLQHTEAEVIPALSRLRHQVIHQDAHDGNVLVSADDSTQVCGLIDFGDMLYGSIAAEVAVAGYSVIEKPDASLDALCDVVHGFDAVLPLSEGEIDLVFDLICIRHAICAAIIAIRADLKCDEADGIEYVAHHLAVLDELQSIGRVRTTAALRKACRFPVWCPTSSVDAISEAKESALIEARHKVLGLRTTHFYDRPQHFERAKGTYLYGTDGRGYLDFYNNVPQVGHCHPHVVSAISRQAAALNTNTRYLYSSVLEYAERLTERLAPHLDACIFVNSGSEANDVAWQMARFITGHCGGLLMEDGYHGITDPIRLFSPGHPDTKLPDFLKGLIVPDPYHDPAPDIAEKYALDADRAIGELEASGHPLAAFMIDSAFCSSGVPDVPDGYLRGVEKRVRAAGGLMICDEVQSGFGRMGQWWGHEHHGVKADIVTMGKPAGNGHPLGVVVTSSNMLNRFIDRTGFFSTFGGNTVACAAGNAVLDVIEREELIENGRIIGGYLRDQLGELANTQALIGDIRGHGMLVGLELVTDREAKTPATAETEQLLELMRQRQVLVGSEGRFGNVLKLRPALVLQREHVDQFIDALDRSLSQIMR